MGLTILIIATCLIFGAIAFAASRGPLSMPKVPKPFTAKDMKRFTPKKTLFLIGPAPNHPPCRLQRRLLKPAVAALIRDDISVIEVYGDLPPRKNGEKIDWLDPSLLRHAMDAEEGFYVIYVDDDGKTVFKSEAPMVTSDILERAGLGAASVGGSSAAKKSLVLKKLSAA